MTPVKYHYGKFPPAEIDWLRLVPLIGPATLALGDFNGLLNAIPNVKLLLAPLTAQEAVLSSRIEGTQATLGEVLEYEAGGERDHSPEKINEFREVLNYRKAIHHAADRLADMPLCGRILKESHNLLLQGVRGKDKVLGQYKTLPNAIGTPGCTEENAKFLPITPDKLAVGMSTWENFLHSDQPDILVQLALIHVEFESLHPFTDGNGRLGRMVLPLFLFERKLLSYPALYLSEYLEAHQEEYYERLLAVSRDDQWTEWCEFFLIAVERQARENTRKAKAILDLYESRKAWILDKTHSQHGVPALDFMFCQPIFKSTDFGLLQGIPRPSARRILNLIREDLLRELSPASGQRPAIFAYPELLNIAEGRDAY